MDEKIYHAYINWKARPIAKDDPQSPEEFCKKFKIKKSDILAFVGSPDYQDDLLTAVLNWAKSKTPELLHIVYNEVKLNKSVADLERFVQLAHEIKKKDKEQKQVTNYNFFTNIKDQQYANIIRREAENLDTGGTESPAEFLPAPKS
jgi:hypothetical protein